MTDQNADRPEKKGKPVIEQPKGRKPDAIVQPGDEAEGHGKPKAIRSRLMAHARPEALPAPQRRGVSALVRPQTLDRWSDAAAGVRPVEAIAMGDNIITMFDQIGESFWSDGVTAKRVSAQLRAIGDRPVEIHINSPGGDMFEGIAIYNVLLQHPQEVTIKVMGMAASAASIIAMAADKLLIGAASFLMIHNCWVVAAGNRHEFREVSEFLEPFDAAMAGVYAARSGGEVDAMAKFMDEETYFNGQQAIDLGLADELLPANQITVEQPAQAADREAANLRAMEISLMASRNMSRTEARAEINKIRGTTDSASKDNTTDSVVDPQPPARSLSIADFSGFLSALKSKG